METGSAQILRLINKGFDSDTVVRSGCMAKDADMILSEFILLGIGGKELSEENAIQTAKALNVIQPDFIRVHATGIKPESKLGEFVRDYGKYGMLRKTYLKEHRPAMYSLYMLEDRLTEHLNAVDDETQEKMDILVSQMMEKQGITEELKARDQMEWVRAVNNVRNAAEEIVLKELIYR